MATKTLLTQIKLRRDSENNYLAKGASFVPLKGEVCLVDTNQQKLRAKVGDGVTSWLDLPYSDEYLLEEIESVVLNGYYLNEKFYTDSTYTVELEKSASKIYIDKNSNVLYHYDGAKFISVNETLPTASDSTAGIMKLYQTGGQNTDGAMSQLAVTDGVQSIHFAADQTDEECLVLDLPWGE